MTMNYLFVAAAMLVATFAVLDCPGQQKDSKVELKLLGTWQLVSTTRDGTPVGNSPTTVTSLMHITPTHYVFMMYNEDGRLGLVIGGRYRVKGDQFEETPEVSSLKGKKENQKATTFNLKFDGNKLHRSRSVEIAGQSVVSEQVWQRLERKDN